MTPPPQLGSSQLGTSKLGSSKLGSSQLGSTKIGSAQTGITKSGTAKVGTGLGTLSGSSALTYTKQSIASIVAGQLQTSAASYTIISGNTFPLIMKGALGSSTLIAGASFLPFMLPAILAGFAIGESYAKFHPREINKKTKNSNNTKETTANLNSDAAIKDNAELDNNDLYNNKQAQESDNLHSEDIDKEEENRQNIPHNKSISTIFNNLLLNNAKEKERRILNKNRLDDIEPQTDQQLFHQLLEHTFRTSQLTHDRRRSARIPVPPNVIKVTWEDSEANQAIGSVVNISLNGILFDAYSVKTNGEKSVVEDDNFSQNSIQSISLSWEDELLTLKNPDIVWTEGSYVAVKFSKD